MARKRLVNGPYMGRKRIANGSKMARSGRGIFEATNNELRRAGDESLPKNAQRVPFQQISPIIKMQTVHISVRVVAKVFDGAVNYAFGFADIQCVVFWECAFSDSWRLGWRGVFDFFELRFDRIDQFRRKNSRRQDLPTIQARESVVEP